MSKDESKELRFSAASDAITKLAFDLIPGAGAAKGIYEIVKFAMDNVIKYQEERANKRAEEFHRGLLEGAPILIGGALDVEDYNSLLKACLDDIENDKSLIYGQLARSIGLFKVEEKYKRFLIIALSQLTSRQVDKLRKAWIASSYTLISSDGLGSISQKDYLVGEVSEIMDEVDYEALSTRRLVKEEKLTVLGNTLVESCYKSAQLLPEAIGKTPWVSGSLDVITAESKHHSTSEFLVRLLSLLRAGLVQAKLNNPESQFRKSEHLRVLSVCVVLIRDVALYSEHAEDIRSLVNGRGVILAFIGARNVEVTKLFDVVDVVESVGVSPSECSDLMNEISKAVRRRVELAKVS